MIIAMAPPPPLVMARRADQQDHSRPTNAIKKTSTPTPNRSGQETPLQDCSISWAWISSGRSGANGVGCRSLSPSLMRRLARCYRDPTAIELAGKNIGAEM